MAQTEWDLLVEAYPNRPDVALIRDLLSIKDEEYLTCAAAKLFWRVYRPVEVNQIAQEIEAESLEDPAGPLPRELEEQVLGSLKSLQERHRVPYLPDGDDFGSKEMLDELTVYAHIAAARAFRIKQSEKLSEEAADCLKEVQSAVARVKLLIRRGVGDLSRSGTGPLGTSEAPPIYVSTGAVAALAQLELARWCRSVVDYEGGLHNLAQATSYFEEAASTTYKEVGKRFHKAVTSTNEPDNAQVDLLELLDDNLLGGTRRDYSSSSGQRRFALAIRASLPISFREAADFLDRLKEKTQSEMNWTQIAKDCRVLAYTEYVGRFGMDANPPHVLEWSVDSYWGEAYINQYGGETIVDEFDDELIETADGYLVTWAEYWQRAHEWTTAQLSPSEYRKMRDADEKDAAERRLKNYFFGDCWPTLPSRAQASLKSADQTWNSKEGGRRESILNELLRATEEMCYDFIWKPLANSRESSLEFLKFEARAIDRHSTPSARDYIRLCKQASFQDHLRLKNLPSKDIQFLGVELPNLLEQLIDRRNPAEHETGSTTAREVIEDCYRRFLGIGSDGVLPELARIGRKLRGSRRGGR